MLRPLKQALALSVDHVQALEHIAVSADTAQERCLAGSLLVLLYARCRFGDGQRASSLSLDMSAASSASLERGFLELSVRTHKTATSLQRRRRILPVVAPIFSLSGCRWHKAWLDARQALKLPVEGDMRVPFLCSHFQRAWYSHRARPYHQRRGCLVTNFVTNKSAWC